jgi:hypothetical protein
MAVGIESVSMAELEAYFKDADPADAAEVEAPDREREPQFEASGDDESDDDE